MTLATSGPIKKVKVLGAGSIGNHLSHAARSMGWAVDIVDPDPAARERTRTQIYPTRYGAWDEQIRLFAPEEAPRGGYDLICVGTPPDSHVRLARVAVAEQPKAVLVEKPVCGPDLEGAQELADEAAAAGVAVFVGYDHVVGRAARAVEDLVKSKSLKDVSTLDVEFREHWGGILTAHPWLAGPWETYLGYSARGGGASGEHSHAANLWQHFAHAAGAGRVVEVQASMDIMRDHGMDYDRLCLMNLRTESGLIGRCVQDVVTRPPRKWARIQAGNGHVEWWCGREPGVDVVTSLVDDGQPNEQKITKTRPDDFLEEMRHISDALQSDPGQSTIALLRALDTMMVVAAAHQSAASGRRARIDYSRGWTPAAISLD
jgi:predicted dehydrogenase